MPMLNSPFSLFNAANSAIPQTTPQISPTLGIDTTGSDLNTPAQSFTPVAPSISGSSVLPTTPIQEPAPASTPSDDDPNMVVDEAQAMDIGSATTEQLTDMLAKLKAAYTELSGRPAMDQANRDEFMDKLMQVDPAAAQAEIEREMLYKIRYNGKGAASAENQVAEQMRHVLNIPTNTPAGLQQRDQALKTAKQYLSGLAGISQQSLSSIPDSDIGADGNEDQSATAAIMALAKAQNAAVTNVNAGLAREASQEMQNSFRGVQNDQQYQNALEVIAATRPDLAQQIRNSHPTYDAGYVAQIEASAKQPATTGTARLMNIIRSSIPTALQNVDDDQSLQEARGHLIAMGANPDMLAAWNVPAQYDPDAVALAIQGGTTFKQAMQNQQLAMNPIHRALGNLNIDKSTGSLIENAVKMALTSEKANIQPGVLGYVTAFNTHWAAANGKDEQIAQAARYAILDALTHVETGGVVREFTSDAGQAVMQLIKNISDIHYIPRISWEAIAPAVEATYNQYARIILPNIKNEMLNSVDAYLKGAGVTDKNVIQSAETIVSNQFFNYGVIGTKPNATRIVSYNDDEDSNNPQLAQTSANTDDGSSTQSPPQPSSMDLGSLYGVS